SSTATAAPRTCAARAGSKCTIVGVLTSGHASIHPGRVVPAPIWWMAAQVRGGPPDVAAKSAPRSKRYDASVESPSRLDVRRIDDGRNHAPSMAIVLVAPETSLSTPPMTP